MQGGLILSGTHNNQFVDAIMLMAFFPREVFFLVAAVSTKNKWLNFFLRIVNFIPTRRPQDEIIKGQGVISSLDGTTLRGVDTDFTKSLGEKYTVTVSSLKKSFVVTRVMDNNTAIVENPENVKIQDSREAFTILPKLDQKEVFDKAWQLLKEGKVVGIFPEGGSHDQTGILPIKAGVAIIYMGAVEKYNADVQVIACGINYDNPHKFRSSAVIEFGVPYSMPDEKVKMYQTDKKKEVISDFLDILTRRLLDVKITAANHEELMLIYLARDLYLSDEGKIDKETQVKVIRSFKENYERGQEQPDMEDLKNDLRQYNLDLKYCGVKDWELKTLDTSTCHNILLLIKSAVFVLSAFTIAIPGFLYISPIRLYLMWFAEKKRKEALKKSSVKIKGYDVVASWKILIGVFLTPAVISVTSWIFFFLFSKRYASTLFGRLFSALIFCILLSLYLVFCVQLLNGIKTHMRICVVRAWVILYRNRIKKIRADRKILKKKVKDIMDKYSELNDLKVYKRKSVVLESSKADWDNEQIFGALADIIG